MNHDQHGGRDPRAAGGQEYAPQEYSQPVMRPAPQSVDPHRFAEAIAAPPPAPPPVVHAAPPTAPGTPDEATAESNVVILSKTYVAHGEWVDRITIRQPVTRDIKKCGNPVKISTDENGAVEDVDLKWDVVAKYISLLASPPLPPSTVDEFDYVDLDACGAVIARFFVKLAP